MLVLRFMGHFRQNQEHPSRVAHAGWNPPTKEFVVPRVLPALWHITTAKRLRTLRLARGLTQQKVATHLHCTYQMYQKVENAKVRLAADTAISLAALFQVDIKELLGLE